MKGRLLAVVALGLVAVTAWRRGCESHESPANSDATPAVEHPETTPVGNQLAIIVPLNDQPTSGLWLYAHSEVQPVWKRLGQTDASGKFIGDTDVAEGAQLLVYDEAGRVLLGSEPLAFWSSESNPQVLNLAAGSLFIQLEQNSKHIMVLLEAMDSPRHDKPWIIDKYDAGKGRLDLGNCSPGGYRANAVVDGAWFTGEVVVEANRQSELRLRQARPAGR